MKKKLANPSQCSQCPIYSRSMLSNVKQEDIEQIDPQLREVLRGQSLDFVEDQKEGFYCLKQGHFKIEYGTKSKSGTVDICGPTELIGFEQSSTIKATAIENSKVCFIEMKNFYKLTKTSPEIAKYFIQILLNRIAERNETIIGLENHSIRNRVAATLLSLSKKFGKPSQYGCHINVNIDRKTLAKLSGTVVESLARVLTEFEDDKVIYRDKRTIHICDQSRLKNYSES